MCFVVTQANKVLQLSPRDSAEVSLLRNPVAVKCTAEPGRWMPKVTQSLIVASSLAWLVACSSSGWPLEHKSKRFFLQHRDHFEWWDALYQSIPQLDKAYCPISRISFDIDGMMISYIEDGEIVGSMSRSEIESLFPASTEPPVSFDQLIETCKSQKMIFFRSGADSSRGFAYVGAHSDDSDTHFNVAIAKPAEPDGVPICPPTVPNSGDGQCNIELSHGWVLNYVWVTIP